MGVNIFLTKLFLTPISRIVNYYDFVRYKIKSNTIHYLTKNKFLVLNEIDFHSYEENEGC